MIFDPLNIEPRKWQPSKDEHDFEFRSTVDPVHRNEDKHQAKNRILKEVGEQLEPFLDQHFGKQET